MSVRRYGCARHPAKLPGGTADVMFPREYPVLRRVQLDGFVELVHTIPKT